MADIIRYIDTDVVGGSGNGTSWANAYASKAAWSAAEGTAIADGDRHLAYFRGVTEDTASAIFNPSSDGWTTTGTGELHFIGDSPDNPTGWDATKYVWQAFAQGAPWRANGLNITISNMQRKFAGNYISSALYVDTGANFKNIVMNHCVNDFRGNVNGTRQTLELSGTGSTSGTFTRNNCLILGDLTKDLFSNYVSGGTYNTTNTTIESVSGTLVVVNNTSSVNYTDTAIGGAFTASTKQTPALTNCATEAGLGTSPVTVTDWALEFTDAANDDFSLLGTSQLLSAGSTGNNIGVYQVAVAPTFTIDSLSTGPYYAGDTVTINVSNASASGKTLSIPAGALTVDSQDATTMTFTVPDPKTFGTKVSPYSSDITITADDGGDTHTIAFQISPTVGHAHATIAATTGIYADDVGVAIGDKAYGYWVVGTGSEDLTVGAIQSDAGGTFRYWIQDDTDSVWGSYADEVIATTPSTPSAPPSKFSVNSLAAYLRETGNYTNTQTNAIVFEWLLSEGVRRTQLNQMLYEFLGGLGHTGSLDDRLAKWDGPASGFPYTFPFTFKSPPPPPLS